MTCPECGKEMDIWTNQEGIAKYACNDCGMLMPIIDEPEVYNLNDEPYGIGR